MNKKEIKELSSLIVNKGGLFNLYGPTEDSLVSIKYSDLDIVIEEYFDSKLPVVSKKVAFYLSKDINRTYLEKIQFLIESRNGDQYYFCEMMPEHGDLTQNDGEWLYGWAQEQSLEFLFSLVNGYKIEGVE